MGQKPPKRRKPNKRRQVPKALPGNTGDFHKLVVVGNAPFREVLVYPETTRKIGLGHPEVPIGMPFMDDAIENAIVTIPELQKSHGKTYVIVDRDTTDHGGQPLRVAVSMVANTAPPSARLASAYFANTEPEGDDDE